MRWVKLTLPPVVRNSWLLTMTRLTSSNLAGATRTLVAVGTRRESSMLATMRPAAPRRGVATSGASSSGATAAGVVGAGADDGAAIDGVTAVVVAATVAVAVVPA